MTYNKIVKTMTEANKARAEAFEDICTAEQAAEKRKGQCKLPEELSPGEREKIEAQYRTEIATKKQQLISALEEWKKSYQNGIKSQKESKAKELVSATLSREMIRKKNKEKGDDVEDGDQKAQEQAEERVIILEESLAYFTYTESYMNLSMPDMIAQSKKLIGKIDVLKKKLEKGDTTLPQDSFVDFFQSPLH